MSERVRMLVAEWARHVVAHSLCLLAQGICLLSHQTRFFFVALDSLQRYPNHDQDPIGLGVGASFSHYS
jgi:hypothetical protein